MTSAKTSLGLILAFSIIVSSSAYSQEAVPVKAPFSTDASAASTVKGSSLMGMYDTERAEDVIPLDKPHRTTEQVASWVEDNIATSMNIDPTKWDQHLKTLAPKFDTYGFQEYQNYLKTSGILEALKTNNMRLNSIADSSSILLSEGALGGSYHWLYQMPMMLTYYNQATKTLKKGSVQSQNRKIMVRVQVGRIAKGADDNNLVIERWSVLPLR